MEIAILAISIGEYNAVAAGSHFRPFSMESFLQFGCPKVAEKSVFAFTRLHDDASSCLF